MLNKKYLHKIFNSFFKCILQSMFIDFCLIPFTVNRYKKQSTTYELNNYQKKKKKKK